MKNTEHSRLTPKCEWEYSHYSATLKRKGKIFAIVTPDGKNSLNPFEAFVLLKALNGSKSKSPNAKYGDSQQPKDL